MSRKYAVTLAIEIDGKTRIWVNTRQAKELLDDLAATAMGFPKYIRLARLVLYLDQKV